MTNDKELYQKEKCEGNIIEDVLNNLIKSQRTKEQRQELRKFYESHKPIIMFTLLETIQKCQKEFEKEIENPSNPEFWFKVLTNSPKLEGLIRRDERQKITDKLKQKIEEDGDKFACNITNNPNELVLCCKDTIIRALRKEDIQLEEACDIVFDLERETVLATRKYILQQLLSEIDLKQKQNQKKRTEK